jgi:hypothetical protein
MKILIIALPTTIEYIVPLLEADGHDVLLLTGANDTIRAQAGPAFAPVELFNGDDDAIAYLGVEITRFAPNMVINMIPWIALPSSSDYTYIGNTTASARLETHKWETRTKAGELGWNLPTLLEECDMNAVAEYDKTVYVKPKDECTSRQIFKLPTNSDSNASELFNEIITNEGYDVEAYVEDTVDYTVEAWCFFTISNGSYSIIRTLGCTGYGDDKLITAPTDWTSAGDFTYVDLTDTQQSAWVTKCEAWLDYAVTLGGNYEGSIGGAIDDDNEVYWFEHNSRSGTYNAGMLPGTAQDWIDGLTTDSTKSINQISAATLRSERGFG